jgi:hypothetical protein
MSLAKMTGRTHQLAAVIVGGVNALEGASFSHA